MHYHYRTLYHSASPIQHGTQLSYALPQLHVTPPHRYSTLPHLAPPKRGFTMHYHNYTSLHSTDTTLHFTKHYRYNTELNSAMLCHTIRRSTPPSQHCTSLNITVTKQYGTRLSIADASQRLTLLYRYTTIRCFALPIQHGTVLDFTLPLLTTCHNKSIQN